MFWFQYRTLRSATGLLTFHWTYIFNEVTKNVSIQKTIRNEHQKLSSINQSGTLFTSHRLRMMVILRLVRYLLFVTHVFGRNGPIGYELWTRRLTARNLPAKCLRSKNGRRLTLKDLIYFHKLYFAFLQSLWWPFFKNVHVSCDNSKT